MDGSGGEYLGVCDQDWKEEDDRSSLKKLKPLKDRGKKQNNSGKPRTYSLLREDA